MRLTVAVNDFVRRQTSGSGKTFSNELIFEEIAAHAQEQLANGLFRPGYRDGVILVQVVQEMVAKFVCPFIKIDENTKFITRYIRRREGEDPYIQIRALNGKPLSAGKVELVLYSHAVLAENNEQTTDADWELISINAIPQGVDQLPMGPATMMRNQMELPGGTAAYYNSNEWAESVRFWQQYAALEPEENQ
ncbi:MAG: DUF3228 family protein [Candidatus Marinimicrobia bacterium]|nr:DUF3228 family protein [Candidatus Neomarinimicrobiota bacterium]